MSRGFTAAQATTGFLPKAESGILANYCARCNSHLELHGFERLVGHRGGTVRSCPVSNVSNVSSARDSLSQQPLHNSEGAAGLFPAETFASTAATRRTSPDPAQPNAHSLIDPIPTPYGTDYTEADQPWHPSRGNAAMKATTGQHLRGGCVVAPYDETPARGRRPLGGGETEPQPFEGLPHVPRHNDRRQSHLIGAGLTPSDATLPTDHEPKVSRVGGKHIPMYVVTPNEPNAYDRGDTSIASTIASSASVPRGKRTSLMGGSVCAL